MKIKIFSLLIISLIVSCNQFSNSNNFPDQIGEYRINSVVEGDSAKIEINRLHHMSVASYKNIVIRYGYNSEDILYISEFKDYSTVKQALKNMISKMQGNKNIPFSYLVPMKNYKKSYMTIGLGSIHYIYASTNCLVWYSTKQKFYNNLPEELLEIYPVHQ